MEIPWQIQIITNGCHKENSVPITASHVKQWWPWLAFGVIFVVIGAAVLIVAFWPNKLEPVIRLTGLVFQLLGIGTVIWGISETRALFGHSSFAAKAKTWFTRLLFRRKNNIILSGTPSVAAVNSKGGDVTHGTAPNPTIESRLDSLERNISLIHERISGTKKEMNEKFRKTAEALRNEKQTRQTKDNAIGKKLEATGTGGVHISAIGALWLFVGVVLSTASVEIAELLQSL